MKIIPEPGSTIRAYCDCAKQETTWVVTTISPGSKDKIHYYTYYYKCLNCNKERVIGTWYQNGEPYHS